MGNIQKEVKVTVFFIFHNSFDFVQETPLWTFLGLKLTFCISCLIALFFLRVLVWELGVHCYFVFVKTWKSNVKNIRVLVFSFYCDWGQICKFSLIGWIQFRKINPINQDCVLRRHSQDLCKHLKMESFVTVVYC